MSSSLRQVMLAPDVKPQVVADCQALVEAELSAKSGVSAAGLKVAYKVVTGLAPGYYRSMVETMLPDMADQLEPYWAEFSTSGAGDFGDYLVKRGDEVAQDLLKVTDTMAENSDRPSVAKAYKAVRGGAAKHIVAALPNLGALVQQHMAA